MVAELIARYPVAGPNVVERGFPKYLAPGEPEPLVEAASRRQRMDSRLRGNDAGEVNSPLLKEGRVYISRGTGVPPVAGHGQDAHATGQYFEGGHAHSWSPATRATMMHLRPCERYCKRLRQREGTKKPQAAD